jgi:hypothetical protein
MGRVSLDDENNRGDDKRLLSPLNGMTDGMALPPYQVAKKDGNIMGFSHHPVGPLGNDENFEHNKPNGNMYAMMPYAMPPSFLLASAKKNMTTGGGGMDLPTHPCAQFTMEWPNHPSCAPIGDGGGGNNAAIFKNDNKGVSQNEQEGGYDSDDDDEDSDDGDEEDEEDHNEAYKTQQNSLSVAPPAPLQPANHPYSQYAPPLPYPQPPYAMPYQMTTGPAVVRTSGTSQHTANEPFSFCQATANGVEGRASVARLLGASESFPEKLYNMLETCDREGLVDIVGWLSHGRAFAIHKPRLFVSRVLPRFFKQQTKLTSFQRQLNLYGFRRISDGPDLNGYYHKFFLRGRPGLTVNLRRIVRPKGSSPQAKGAPDPEPKYVMFCVVRSYP